MTYPMDPNSRDSREPPKAAEPVQSPVQNSESRSTPSAHGAPAPELPQAEEWLVRSAKNVISGPHKRDDVCRMVTTGELGLQDEVCAGGSYWIYLHEREEIKKQLGVDVPKSKGGEEETDEEITETETASDDLDLLLNQNLANQISADDSTSILSTRLMRDRLSLKVSAAFNAASSSTAATTSKVLGGGAGQVQPRSIEFSGAAPSPEGVPGNPVRSPAVIRPNLQILGPIERPSVWRGLAWLLITTAGLLVYAVLRALRDRAGLGG